MMRKIIIVFIMSLMILPAKSQEKNELTDIIISSLKTYYNYHLNSEYRKSTFSYSSIGDTSLFLSVENYPFNLYEKLQENHVQYVDIKYSIKYSIFKQNGKSQFQRYRIKRKIKKGIDVIFLKELKLSSDTLIIVFSKEIVTYKKYLSFAVGDWGIFKYIYSVEKDQWVLIRKEFVGI